MNEMNKINAKIIQIRKKATGIYDISFDAKEIAKKAIPGQFIAVYSNDKSRMLPRPISICNVDKERGLVRIVFRVVGKGTDEFSKAKVDDTFDIMGPLGNGFPEVTDDTIVVGGGIGIPPMLNVALNSPKKVKAVLGFRDELFLTDEFEKCSDLYIASEDGKHGVKGNVVDALKEYDLKPDTIYACGPTPMLRALKSYCEEKDIKLYVSLEERMGCGIGACLACVCKTKEIDGHSNVNNARICKEGPVFLATEVEL